jgi:hypothetical protein
MKVVCSTCGVNLKAPDELAGKTAKCPKCGNAVEVPESTQPAKRIPIPPATERQKEYASELGIVFPPDINRRDISSLIDAAIQKRDNERFQRLDELGKRENEAWQQMREAVLKEIDEEDCRISAAQPKQMIDELADRGFGAILIWFDIDDLDHLISNSPDVKVNVSFADLISEMEMRSVLRVIGVEASKT